MKSAPVLLLVLVPVASAIGRPVTAEKVQDVIRILRAIPDPSRKELDAAGSDVDRALTLVVEDSKADETLRQRAARSLGRYPSPSVRGLLTGMMNSRLHATGLRTAAMIGLARGFREEAFHDLKPFLIDTSPAVRAGAATAMGEVGGPRARALLLDSIAHESDIDVRLTMEEALKKL
jgi:HEAT repeat protein